MSARAGEKTALSILGRVLEEGAYFNLTLAEELKSHNLSGKDRSAAVAYGKLTLENLFAVDFALSQVTDISRCKKQIRNILRLAAARLLFTNTPSAVCTDAAVELAKAVGKGAQARYVNAVLRNLGRKREEIPWPKQEENPIQALSIRYSWPEFAVEEAIELFGIEEACAFLAPRPARIALRNQRQHQTREQLIQRLEQLGGKAEPSLFYDQGVLLSGLDDLTSLEEYQRGDFSIQSEASMLLTALAKPEHGLVLDLCAAPGGKACGIAEALGAGGRIVASDLHPHRTELIRAQAKRLGLDNLECRTMDAAQFHKEYVKTADAVLLDVPCSGLGTAQHRPDVKFHRKKEDIAKLSGIQRNILNTCADYTKPGGILVYSTCTFLREENESVVQDFLRSRQDFRVADLSEQLPESLKNRQAKYGLRLLPQQDGTDAFYICKMERTH